MIRTQDTALLLALLTAGLPISGVAALVMACVTMRVGGRK